MDFIDSIINTNVQFLQQALKESSQKLNLFDFDAFKGTMSKALEDDDTDVLQHLLSDLKLRNKAAAGDLKKFKDGEKKSARTKVAASKKSVANDENAQQLENTQTSGRPRRKAFADANERVNSQVKQNLNTKLRREDVIIKTERISEVPLKTPQDDKQQHQEENEKPVEMPPPAAAPKRAGRKKKTEATIKVERPARSTSTRSTRSRNTNAIPEKPEEEEPEPVTGKRSDVVLVEQHVPMISLDSNDEKDEQTDTNQEDDEEQLLAPDLPKHSAVAKARTKNVKRFASSPAENKKASLPKRQKRKESLHEKDSDVSQYEDAIAIPPAVVPVKKMSHGNQEVIVQLPTVLLNPLPDDNNANRTVTKAVLNGTYVKPASNPNETVVVEKPQVVKPAVIAKPENLADIMTDDESEVGSPPLSSKSKVAKELFNPFENSPLKKKIEAFEKLGTKAAAETTRMTRTKSRLKKTTATPSSDKSLPPVSKQPYITPTAGNRMIPTLTSTAKGNLSESAKKTFSAIKLTSQRFRNYEQVHKEKEEEALRKKELLMQKQTEDKRRKREEKEAKAKLLRDEQEKERLRLQEAQKAKEELLKKRLQQQADKVQKQREDAEKRRVLAKIKHDEMKREEERKRADEERKRIEEERKQEDEERRYEEEERKRAAEEARLAQRQQLQRQQEADLRRLPIYMTKMAPLLPTPDCYDSDDENAPKQHAALPAWNSRESMQSRLRVMTFIEDRYRNTLFCPKPQTPDLQELFPNVDPHKLRRNSSAIWKEAPRFTMMANIDEDF